MNNDNNTNKVQLSSDQALALRKRVYVEIDHIYSQLVNDNEMSAPENKLSVKQLVDKALVKAREYWNTQIKVGNYDPNSCLAFADPKLIEKCEALIRGSQTPLSEIEAKYLAIKAKRKAETEDDASGLMSRLRKFGYDIKVNGSELEITPEGSKKQKIQWHVNELRKLGLQISELEYIKDETE